MLTAKLSTPVNLRGDIYRGVGGTSDYNNLDNKPSINNIILEGNKTTQELGIQTIVNVEYNVPFDTGKRINNKIIYGYYNISTPVSRANWNDCVRVLTGLPLDITLVYWDVKYMANVYWQKGESNDSLYITKGANNWNVTCYYTYNYPTAPIYTYVEYIEND